jgi:hypothetical protein
VRIRQPEQTTVLLSTREYNKHENETFPKRRVLPGPPEVTENNQIPYYG